MKNYLRRFSKLPGKLPLLLQRLLIQGAILKMMTLSHFLL